jgi:hypothetical protein
MIVHEWGHLRWGVFDEYATTLETAYRSSLGGKTKATACSVDLANKVFLLLHILPVPHLCVYLLQCP